MLSPSDEYRVRLGRRQSEAESLAARDRLLSYARLLVFLAGIVVVVAWWRGGADVWWLAVPALALAALVRVHDRVIRARLAAERDRTASRRDGHLVAILNAMLAGQHGVHFEERLGVLIHQGPDATRLRP
jgi:hypothetical protein